MELGLAVIIVVALILVRNYQVREKKKKVNQGWLGKVD